MTVRSKAFLLEPGEELLLSSSAITVASRFDEFVTASGLEPDKVLGDPLCATPIPVYEKDERGHIKRFANADPSFMWHPLMWLPANSALRYQMRISEDSQELRLESDHEWAIRIALELRAAGLYNPVTGEWLDILSVHGIDIDNPVDYARVEAWLAGTADEALDAVDLTDVIMPDPDNDWSLLASQELTQVFVPAQWTLTASSLLDTLNVQGSALTDADDKKRLNRVVCELAIEMLGDVPVVDVDTDSTEDQFLDVFDAMEEADHDVAAATAALVTALTSIRDDFAIALETLEASENEQRE